MEQKKILFVSHDANRAGSQLLLLQLLRLLKARGVPMHLLLCNGGELEHEFEQVCGVTKLYHSVRVTPSPITGRLLRKVNLHKLYEERSAQRVSGRIAAELDVQHIGLVFINSIANAGVYYESLKFLHHLPLVVFAHELGMSVKIYTHEKHLQFLLKQADHLIAVSQAVARYYIARFGYSEKRVSTFTLFDHHHIDHKLQYIQHDILEKTYRVPEDAIVIGGCGNAEWRKGNDLFNWIAKSVIQKTSPLPVYFVWVGAGPQHEIYDLIESDIRQMGLTERIILVPPTSQALDYINRFDVLLLSSREDPYPLVVLEAAWQEIPVVCFDNAGGAPELVESDAGFVVPFMDIPAATDAIIRLVLDQSMRETMGNNARKKVLERHNADKSVARIEAIVQKYLPLQISEQHNQ
ncbi:glycosyltransferase family 4 protein [Dyadobacter sandarakinus]|uniref:Glycosyltransferase family 4 protein n=1 Tax=Dyadobacter sandarakinus TaxID=2747268 RepID=A0ABX7ICU8_9BACT|nr:glycosyltransferase family 4 protein [Dyadobacter sandarakinus]QRR03735.1 glycosyltransferase family 4 protein [Dyadobacter sandarakinus]